MNLKDLTKPINSKWRVQSFSKNKPVATCVPYIDSRDVQNRLDEVCEPQNWQSDYKEVKGNVYGGIGILIGDRWVWKWDCGVESNVEKQKGEASDAFKRAAVKWGIGRDLYESDLVYVATNEAKIPTNFPYCIGPDKKRIWDLTDHINSMRSDKPKWWGQAVIYMRDGGDINKIKANYTLTPEQEKELLNAN